ncbi:unnamed protein product [Linum tenue]|uniref:DCD domain-containing protein n=1 Tax=Linum tenue TaxID=586396 RepID=A0AAV0LDI7_9ROSI|nr:unnamed protein product [Linum tenue]
MDRELENRNEKADDFVQSPSNSRSADENYEEIEDAEGTFPPSQIDERDDEEAEFLAESSSQFHSGAGEMIEEGENLVEESPEPQINEEAEVVVEALSKVVGTSKRSSKSLGTKPKDVEKSPAGNSLKRSSPVGTAEVAMESTTKLNSGDDQMIDEGKNPVVEESNKSQTDQEKSDEAEDPMDSSDKAETPKRIAKPLQARSKVAKKSPAGNSAKKSNMIGVAEILIDPSTELNSADDQMIDEGEKLLIETVKPRTDEKKTEEAEDFVEGSDKADTSGRTPNSLQARPKIANKASAAKVKSAAGTAATGNKQLKGKIIKKKGLRVGNKLSARSENGVVMGLAAAENVQKKDIVADIEPGEKDHVKTPANELIVGESSKSQEDQKNNGNQTGTTRIRVRNRKNKRKIDGGAVNQNVEKKKKIDTSDKVHQDENKRKNVLGVDDKSPKDEKRKGKNIANDNKSNQDEKEEIDHKKSAQNMKNERLGGLIFMCSSKTRPDVFNYGVMGETIGKKEIVRNIKPGLKLFLYDFERRVMHGIYEASSSGGIKLEPKAFGGSFPAQVRFRIYKECSPLPESTFKKAIKENYNKKNKFDIKLTVRQVRKLITLFRPAASSLPQTKPLPAHPAQAAARDREPPRSGRRDRSERDAFAKPRDRSHRRDPATKLKENRSWQHPPARRRHERDLPIRSRELLASPVQRRDPPPARERDLYMSEREYRTYGLQSDQRNLSPMLRRSLDRERECERERLVRQAESPIYRDPLRVEPLYYTHHQQVGDPYIPSARGGELHYGPSSSVAATASIPTSGLDSYVRDSYYSVAYDYGTGTLSSYLPSLRRDVGSGYSSYLPVGREPERLDLLRSGYATTLDRLSSYDDPRYYSEASAEAAAATAPVSSRYSFAGPSSYSYR